MLCPMGSTVRFPAFMWVCVQFLLDAFAQPLSAEPVTHQGDPQFVLSSRTNSLSCCNVFLYFVLVFRFPNRLYNHDSLVRRSGLIQLKLRTSGCQVLIYVSC